MLLLLDYYYTITITILLFYYSEAEGREAHGHAMVLVCVDSRAAQISRVARQDIKGVFRRVLNHLRVYYLHHLKSN